MSVLTSIQRTFGQFVASVNGSAFPLRQAVDYALTPAELPPAAMYALLKAFYLSNGLYDDLARANIALGYATPSVKAIRNPVPPVVDFWGSKLWPNPLVIQAKRAAIVQPIETVWRWSNWLSKRPLVGRWVALYGEAFIKVQASQTKGRVWFEYLEPAYVTDFTEDERGFIAMIRVDIPKVEEDASGSKKLVTHTEVWDADLQTYRRWENSGDASQRPVRSLGTPVEEDPLSAFGIDFVPFVRIPFSEIGEKRAIGAVQLALETIVEGDISATNLHAMLYQDADGAWVLKSVGTDANGRPLPPPLVGQASANGLAGRQSDNTITVGKRSFWRLPGNQELESVIADIDYESALAILRDHDEQSERLMPALAYARISEMEGSDLTGRAIRFKLTPAVDQVEGVRAVALEKLAQADAMALTFGRVNGLAEFAGIGSFDAGDFEHTFEPKDVLPIGAFEEGQAEAQLAQSYATWRTAGLPDIEALQRAGYTKAEATRIVRLAATEAEEAMQRQQALLEAQPDQQQGDDGE